MDDYKNALRDVRSSEEDWRHFESDRWREAVRNRGLRMHSLDADERELVFEAITADLQRRKMQGRSIAG